MSGTVETVKDDGVLLITLSNPEVRNALTPTMINDLHAILHDAMRNPTIAVVVITGRGEAFCTGADVRMLGKNADNDPLAIDHGEHPGWNTIEMRGERVRRSGNNAFLLHTMGKPTISMIRGAAAGAGLGLALAPDFRFAADDAFITTAFAKLGVSGDFGSGWFLRHLVGPTKAKELLFLSRRVTAAEALAIGLVDRVCPATELERETMAFARELAKGPALAYRLIKQNIAFAETASLGDYMDLEARNMARTLLSDDAREGIAAFKERRAPKFTGN